MSKSLRTTKILLFIEESKDEIYVISEDTGTMECSTSSMLYGLWLNISEGRRSVTDIYNRCITQRVIACRIDITEIQFQHIRLRQVITLAMWTTPVRGESQMDCITTVHCAGENQRRKPQKRKEDISNA